jgi:hypothetical protein
MNESQIRARVHAALGEAVYPASLGARAAGRITSSPKHSRAYGLVAALLAVLLIATLVFTRFGLAGSPAPAFHTNQVVGPVNPDARLPPEDLRAAGLSEPQAGLVTALNLTAVSQGKTVHLIGAYADTARVVLFFRGADDRFSIQCQIYDRTGFLNFGAGASSGLPGDWVFELMGAAHPDAHGIAHLNVAAFGYQTDPGTEGVSGTWNFSFDLPVHLAERIALTPPLTAIGPWKVKVEAMEATPTVLRFQVLVEGASASDLSDAKVTLLDSSGREVPQSSAYTMLTNSMFFSLILGTPQTRISVIWDRPPAGTFELRFSVRGSDYRATLAVPPG